MREWRVAAAEDEKEWQEYLEKIYDGRYRSGRVTVAKDRGQAEPGFLERYPLSTHAKLPIRATLKSAGLDLFSVDDVVIQPRKSAVVSLGLSMCMPSNKQGIVYARSGLAVSHMMVAGKELLIKITEGMSRLLFSNSVTKCCMSVKG